jgi:hypothetical protein
LTSNNRSVWLWKVDRSVLAALIAYAAITVALFWPILANLSTSTLAPNILRPDQDRLHFIWNFWWERKSLFSGNNVFYTNYMFAPAGTSLAFQTLDFVDAALNAPLAVLLGELAAYNLVIVASFAISGFTAFLLGKHLTNSWIAAFGGGLIFEYFPQHVNQAYFGHPNFSSIEWLPVYLLALMLTYERRQYRYAIAAGVLLSLVTYTELELLIIAMIATLVYLLYHLIRTRFVSLRKFALVTSVASSVWLGLSSFYLIPAYLATRSSLHPPPNVLQVFSNAAKPIFYITPPPASFLYGNLFAPNYSNLSPYLPPGSLGGPSQWIIFVGFVTLALSCIGIILSKDKRRFFFLAVAIVAFIASLGPSQNPSELSIQTPYTFLYDHFAIIQYFRTGARFSILLMLALTGLAAFGIESILKLSSIGSGFWTKYGGKIIGLVILSLILLEFAPVVTTQTLTTDPAYNMIAADHSNFSVLLLPPSILVTDLGLYGATIFNKPLVDGKISQIGTVLPNYMFYQEFLGLLVNPTSKTLSNANNPVVDQPLNETLLGPMVLSMYHIKYVIVYSRNIFSRTGISYSYSTLGGRFAILNQLLEQGLGPPVYQDQNLEMFELQNWLSMNTVLQMAKSGPIVLLGPGWSPEITQVIGGNVRIANDSAQLMVYAATPGMYPMRLRANSGPICITNLNYSETAACGSYSVASGVETGQIWLNTGENTLSFNFADSTINVTSIRIG